MLVGPDGAAASFQGISDAVNGIVAAAADAGFTISENGGQALLNAIQDLQEEVRTALGKAMFLEQEPALGTTPNANVYKPFLATVASDPTQGAIPVLRKLQTDLNNAHAAIQKSMANYQATEQNNTSAVNSTWV